MAPGREPKGSEDPGLDTAHDEAPAVSAYAVSAAPPELIQVGDLALRRWTRSDTDELFTVVERSVDHLRPFMVWAPASTSGHIQDYLDRSHDQWEQRTAFQYALTLPESGEIVGSAGLMGRIGPAALEIGYWVAVDRTGRRLATRAAAGLTAAGLSIPGVEHAEIHHDAANTLSGRVPARLGYQRVGELAVPPEAEGETGTRVVWQMRVQAWPGSPGARLLEGTRAGERLPGNRSGPGDPRAIASVVEGGEATDPGR